MTTKEKHLALIRWLDSYCRIREQMDALSKLTGGDSTSPLANAVWRQFDAYTDTLSFLLNDQGGWLNWFIWDNNCGADAKLVRIDKTRRKIRNVRDLLWCVTHHVNDVTHPTK